MRCDEASDDLPALALRRYDATPARLYRSPSTTPGAKNKAAERRHCRLRRRDRIDNEGNIHAEENDGSAATKSARQEEEREGAYSQQP